MSATVQHEVALHRGAMGSFYSGCKACPAWISPPEQSRPEAIRHHTVHRFEASRSAGAAPAVDVDRVMSRLVGPLIMFVLLPAWLLATGGAL